MSKSWFLMFLAPVISYAAYPVYDNWEQGEIAQGDEWVEVEQERQSSIAFDQEIEQLSEEPSQSMQENSIEQRRSAPAIRRQAPRARIQEESTAYEDSISEEGAVVSEERRAPTVQQPQRQLKKRPSVTQRRQLSQGEGRQAAPQRRSSEQAEQRATKSQKNMTQNEWSDELAERKEQKSPKRTVHGQRYQDKKVAKGDGQSTMNRRSQPVRSKPLSKGRVKSHHAGKRPLGE